MNEPNDFPGGSIGGKVPAFNEENRQHVEASNTMTKEQAMAGTLRDELRRYPRQEDRERLAASYELDAAKMDIAEDDLSSLRAWAPFYRTHAKNLREAP